MRQRSLRHGGRPLPFAGPHQVCKMKDLVMKEESVPSFANRLYYRPVQNQGEPPALQGPSPQLREHPQTNH